MSPQRIQLRRTKGWRKPEGAVVVARPSAWGNPYAVQEVDRHGIYPYGYRVPADPSVASHRHIYQTAALAATRAVELYRRYIESRSDEHKALIRAELAGHDLACWCPLDQPCHADVLLDLANRWTP